MTITKDTPITCFVNNCLWHRISSSIEDATHYDLDGLHLPANGKEAVVKEWLTIIFPDITFPEDAEAADPE